jgi:formate hydrogenlyase subunit 3/multisubunit Na+/H+ antiporter MnhD subunit
MPEERRSTEVLPPLWISLFCRRHKMAAITIRKVGVSCGLAAVVAVGLAVITDNRNLGFGYHIARRDQLWLFLVAITLCALHAALYRMARGREDNAERDKRNKRS